MALSAKDQMLLQKDSSLVNFSLRWGFSIKMQFCKFWDNIYVWKKNIFKFRWHYISVWSLGLYIQLTDNCLICHTTSNLFHVFYGCMFECLFLICLRFLSEIISRITTVSNSGYMTFDFHCL